MREDIKARREKKQKRMERGAYRTLKAHVLDLFTRREIEELARKSGFYKRKPKEIHAHDFVVCCILASVAEGKRGFAAVWRMLTAAAGIEVARSAVTQRFGEGSAKMMEVVFQRVTERLESPSHPELLGKLEQFRQVLARDGTVLMLSPVLKKMFPATRTNSMGAAAKLHVTADLVHRRVVRVELTGERESELRVARSEPVESGTLYIQDLGYFSYDHFAEIFDGGGDMLSRLKINANPFVMEVRHGVKAPRRSEGMAFQDIEFTRSHDTFDLDAAFATTQGGEAIVLRVVGCWNRETQKYHNYVTTLRPEQFSAEELADLYSLRWIVELMMKLLKSACHLDHLDTSNEAALRTHIYASLLASLLLSSMCIAAASYAGIHPSEISPLVAGIAAPLLVVPLLLLLLERELTAEEVAAMILRTLAFGCRDQNPGRTRRKWGALS